jgi:hypothetical protein
VIFKDQLPKIVWMDTNRIIMYLTNKINLAFVYQAQGKFGPCGFGIRLGLQDAKVVFDTVFQYFQIIAALQHRDEAVLAILLGKGGQNPPQAGISLPG